MKNLSKNDIGLLIMPKIFNRLTLFIKIAYHTKIITLLFHMEQKITL